MIDFTSELERTRLHRAISTSRDVLDPFRRVRSEFIRDHAGSWYSQNGARFATYANKMNQTASILSFALVGGSPRYKCVSSDPKNRPFAYHLQENLNRLVSNINLEQSLYLMVLDAIFLMGVAKVRMADDEDRQLEDDTWVDVGRPWVDRVSVDDLILDLSARDLTKMRFAGDRYRCSWAKVKERSGGDFDAKVVKQLAPNSKYLFDTGSEYANQIANCMAVDDDELEPMIWLEDVWVAENKQWVTFPASPGLDSVKPLKVVDWEGSPRGPYKYLSLGFVPDNVIPSSPAQNLKGLHDVYNRLLRKMIHQASISKQVVGFPPGQAKEADNARNAKNGDWLPFNNPKDIATITIGTVDGNIHAFTAALDEIFNVQSGNIRSLGGLGAEAQTARQESQIAQHSSGVIGKMSQNVMRFTGEIGEELKNLMWDDGAFEQETWVDAGNTGEKAPSNWTPDYREGERDNYSLKVVPYSLMYRSPQMELQQISEVLNQIGPLYPMIQAGILDGKELFNLYAENLDLPILKRLFRMLSQQPNQGGGRPQLGGDENTVHSPAVTSREVVRRNVPTGGTAANRGAMLSQAMMGKSSASPQQMASMKRAPV